MSKVNENLNVSTNAEKSQEITDEQRGFTMKSFKDSLFSKISNIFTKETENEKAKVKGPKFPC